MELNVKKLSNPDIVMNLFANYFCKESLLEDWVSFHWKEYGKKINVHINNDGFIKSLQGYGFGDLEYTSIAHRIGSCLCNPSYFIKMSHQYKRDINFLSTIAEENLKRIESYLCYECFRQVCSFSTIRQYFNADKDNKFRVLIIGDGYGFLSSLVKRCYPNCLITLVDIGKILLFQAVNLQRIFPLCIHRLISQDKDQDVRADFLYVPAESLQRIKEGQYRLIINIASMQEMNNDSINSYFKFIRMNATRDNLFYCCNRELKILPGGEVIDFFKYPWMNEDRYLFDEICPFFKYFFSRQPPFIHKFDGPIRHRLVNLKIGI